MEGDAGAGRLNPPPMPTNRRLRRRNRTFKPTSSAEPSPAPTEVTAEDPSGSEDGADPTDTEVTAEDPSGSEDGADPTDTEVTAEGPSESAAGDASEAEAPASGGGRRPSRLSSRRWLAGIAALLVLSAGGIGAGGYLALRYHHKAQAIAREDAAALKAAVDCVSATQAPDTTAMAASERKIIDCGTDAFRSQALLYTSMIVQAYQAANVHVQVADVRAAVERNNSDGSIDVLVAMRVKVDSDQSQKETGYRLRVKMALDEGQYKISKLDQVTK
ncbi:mce associated membrane protein [Mycobacterium bohemicum DSM 44277]|uniref:Mce associated membrane protein n=1 Tax=Mycobacterium bohemicum DSM 44277 TaxID=1236609 RepID=A0A0U0WE54_MYCBE|nr:Mce protein [Mycobacterium bohemicum]CPR13053.1 mce associated membrane protein [Mycobacterium bohemicum DSM 44277]